MEEEGGQRRDSAIPIRGHKARNETLVRRNSNQGENLSTVISHSISAKDDRGMEEEGGQA
jgi:hypothetical protein